jgi:hypothetical protein
MANLNLTQHLEWLRARAAAAQAAAQASTPAEAPPPTPAVQLPLWPEPVRGVPNSILRSALFGAIRRGKRAFMQRHEIASYEGVTILQTGPRLDQADLDVWEQCLHLARTGGLGLEIRFTGHGFLKAIGRGTGKSQHEWLKGALSRLMASVVEVQDGKRAYSGQLIHHWYRDDDTGRHVIVINPKIAALYGSDGWTQTEWGQRLALKRQPLAQWLHGFYSTHAQPFPMKVQTIHRLCGSEAARMDHFRSELRDALAALAEATGWTWEIDDADLVHVRKQSSAAQARHLIHRTRHSTGGDTA